MIELEDKIDDILTRGVSEVIDAEHLRLKLKSRDKLRIKLGIDPTSPNIHLGHAATLLKLRDFQELGHQIVLIFGDFTAEIGDTSDKESERPMLSSREVRRNVATYKKQAGKVLDLWKTKIYYNSKWLKKLDYRDIAEQTNLYALSDFVSRTNIKKRLDDGKRISLREVLYPIMQAYDSVMVRASIEIGGTDQRFNILQGRIMQEHFDQTPQDIITLDLLPGTDGEKMSKSKGNTIDLTLNANDMFGKLMSAPDEVMNQYFTQLTRIPRDEINEKLHNIATHEKNPRDVKMDLAEEVTSVFHGREQALKARDYFVTVFQSKEVPDEIETKSVSATAIDDVLVEVGFAKSKSDARRVIEQKGVHINEKVADLDTKISSGDIVQKGKRHFIKIK